MRVAFETKSRILAILANTRKKSPKLAGFTLVELIVVITILAILATIGFLALSGYSSDAKDASIKANVRSVHTAISSESAITGNSPRYYVVHDANAELSGAFVYVDGAQTALTGGNWNDAGTNYTAGNPDYVKLKMNPEKFKVSVSPFVPRAFAAAYDSKYLSVGALDVVQGVGTSRPRPLSWFQVAGVDPVTKKASVVGTFPNTFSSGGSSAGLIRDPSWTATWAVIDGAVAGTVVSSGPTGPTDPSYGNVSLLLHGDGTNGGQNNAFVDSSPNNLTVTKVGNVAQGAYSPFGTQGGSAYFDGAGDYLSLPANNVWLATGAGDFTIEGWAKLSSFYNYQIIYDSQSSNVAGFVSVAVNSAGTFSCGTYDGSTRPGSNAPGTVALNTWFHFACVRTGNSWKAYLNGAGGTPFTSSLSVLAADPRIGMNPASASERLTGYVSNFRVVKSALYSSDFAPASAPLTSVANTSVLLKFENSSVTDSAKQNDMETLGNAQVSNAQSVFWWSSIAFDGAGDYLDLSPNDWQNLGSQDWTVETWVRFNNVSTMSQGIFSKDDFQWMALQLNEQTVDGKLAFWLDTTGATPWDFWGSYGKKTTTVFAANQWYHIAITRQSSNLRLYVNGALDWSDTVTGSIYNSTGPLHIGRSQLSTRYMNGNIDDFRVTPGIARYTGTGFTIPTSAYPDQ